MSTEFKVVTAKDLLKAMVFNRCRLAESGCWLWVASKDSGGYGLFYHDNKYFKAHRFSYELFKGPIPEGLHILHSCDAPACVNPDHLRPGTARENMQDRDARGRRNVRGSQIGTSKLTKEEVLFIKLLPELATTDLAKAFGIRREYVWTLQSGKSWAHLNGPAMWAHLNACANLEGVNNGR